MNKGDDNIAAPSGTIWGDERGSGNKMGRIGIKVSTSDTATTRKVIIDIYLWTRYRCSDSGNNFKYGWSSTPNQKIGPKNINATSNSSWSTTNQIFIASYDNTYTKGVNKYNISASASYENIEYAGGSGKVSINVEIPALASYSISYNANGGTGAPSKQTKWYGKNINISTTIPTKAGHAFRGWSVDNNQTVEYSPGSTYSANSSVTLYAVWQANAYAVTYDANGGSGAPSIQTKTHGVPLTLSNTTPYRQNYTFKGWGIASNSTTVSYFAGDTYTDNASITLYAIWSLSYTEPRITNFYVERCNSNGVATDSGTYARVRFAWFTDKSVTSIKIEYKQESSQVWNAISIYASGTSGSVDRTIGGSFSTDYTYNIRVTVYDSLGSHNTIKSVDGVSYTIDALAGGKGVAFGKPATKQRLVDSAWSISAPDFKGAWHVEDDSASTQTSPTDYNSNARFWGMKNQNTIGLSTGASYAYLMGLKGWNDQSEGRAHEFAFHNHGIHHRIADDDSTWGVWEKMIEPRYLKEGTDLNNVREPGIYYGDSGEYLNVPAARYKSSFTLEVYPSGSSGQLIQKLTRCHKSESMTFERAYYENGFGSWATIYSKAKILWSGGYYMTTAHTATLSEPISQQTHGVILVFTPFIDNVMKNYDRNTFYIPKQLVSMHNGQSMLFTSTGSMPGNIVANKCLFIFDDKITGHSQNTFVGQVGGSNIYIQNNKFVLQYVIGI